MVRAVEMATVSEVRPGILMAGSTAAGSAAGVVLISARGVAKSSTVFSSSLCSGGEDMRRLLVFDKDTMGWKAWTDERTIVIAVAARRKEENRMVSVVFVVVRIIYATKVCM